MPVKCRDCGYLAKHADTPRAPTPRYYEIDIGDRDHASLFFTHVADGFQGAIPTEMVCFLNKADLMGECGDYDTDFQRGIEVLRIIKQDRECDGFYPHRYGFDPREHLQTYEMQRLEAERRAHDLKLSELDQRSQENHARIAEQTRAAIEQTQIIAKESKEILRDSKEISRDSKAIVEQIKMIAIDNDRFSKRVTFWVVLLAAVQVIVGLITYFFPRESYLDQLLRQIMGR